MAAPGASFAGKPGRRAGHRHPGAHQADLGAAIGPHAARRAVRARVQPGPARCRDRSGCGRGARMAGAGLAACHPVQRSASHPRRAGRADGAPGWWPRRGGHHRPQAAVFHDALGYAVELGLLQANPVCQARWTAPIAATAVNPQAVASPTQVRAILSEVTHLRPELTAFFGCLYYAALRPEEAVALHSADLVLPPHGQGKLVLTGTCPRTGSAWTSTGTPHEPRSLKHRPDGAVRVVPVPAVLVGLLRQHLREYGTAPDGRLFRGARGGILSESTYGRVWHAVRETALGPELAATPLARRPYDLRHAALSLWLSATSSSSATSSRRCCRGRSGKETSGGRSPGLSSRSRAAEPARPGRRRPGRNWPGWH